MVINEPFGVCWGLIETGCTHNLVPVKCLVMKKQWCRWDLEVSKVNGMRDIKFALLLNSIYGHDYKDYNKLSCFKPDFKQLFHCGSNFVTKILFSTDVSYQQPVDLTFLFVLPLGLTVADQLICLANQIRYCWRLYPSVIDLAVQHMETTVKLYSHSMHVKYG